jgi:tight adherence protein C
MIDMNLVISTAIFVLVLLVFAGLFYYISYREERRKLVGRLKEDEEAPYAPYEKGEVRTVESPLLGIKALFLRLTERAGDFSKPKREEELNYLEKSFLKAGYRDRKIVKNFFGAKILLAVLLPALFIVFKLLAPSAVGHLIMLFLFVLLALAGYYLPNLWLRHKLRVRQEKITEGFPDALDLLVVCVEAGMGLDAAINRVGEEMRLSSPEISDEFKLLTLELRAGKSRREALRNLALRTDLDDVNSLVSLLIQTDRFGTSVAQALRVHSDAMRTKRYQRAEEAAMKLPVKILFPMLFCIFPTLFIVILGPPFIQAFRMWTSR